MRKKTSEEIRRLQELRRSNASQPIKNKTKYTRKKKYKLSDPQDRMEA